MQKSKIKNQNCNSKFKFFWFFTLALLLSCSLALDAQAATPTPEPTPTEEAVMGEKIKEIRDAVKEKVREKLEEVKKGPKRAYVGEIVTISDGLLTLETRPGSRQVEITEEAKIVGLNRQPLQFADLAVGDFVICLGYRPEGDVLLAQRVVVTPVRKPRPRQVVVGRVTDLSSEEKILTVRNEKKDKTYMVDATGAKMITKKVDGKIQKVTFAEIALNDRVVAIGTPTENAEIIINAKIIHIIPGRATGQQPTPELSPTETTPTEAPTTPSPTE